MNIFDVWDFKIPNKTSQDWFNPTSAEVVILKDFNQIPSKGFTKLDSLWVHPGCLKDIQKHIDSNMPVEIPYQYYSKDVNEDFTTFHGKFWNTEINTTLADPKFSGDEYYPDCGWCESTLTEGVDDPLIFDYYTVPKYFKHNWHEVDQHQHCDSDCEKKNFHDSQNHSQCNESWCDSLKRHNQGHHRFCNGAWCEIGGLHQNHNHSKCDERWCNTLRVHNQGDHDNCRGYWCDFRKKILDDFMQNYLILKDDES